jgi:hypothetical protein
MNAARLTRCWQEAAGDPELMVDALVDEFNDPATGLVTRDFLRAELARDREAPMCFGLEPRLCNALRPSAGIASALTFGGRSGSVSVSKYWVSKY